MMKKEAENLNWNMKRNVESKEEGKNETDNDYDISDINGNKWK